MKAGNPAIGGFETAPIRFPIPENIFPDTKIMFLGQLRSKLWQKNGKNDHFWWFFWKKRFQKFPIFFRKLYP